MIFPLRLFPAAAGLVWLFLLTVPAPWLRAANPVIKVKCELVSPPSFDVNTVYNGNTVTPTVNKHCETGNWDEQGTTHRFAQTWSQHPTNPALKIASFISPISVYHHEVIKANPGDFNNRWFNFWGMSK